ncbi:D-glycero-alpha-D-manno-heptose-1,7-bisphosphate 7-phosphatase [Alkalicoccobacillus plakortidis]|uniref:D,D-heptose 1,7-bisphosphate phosphatase n=1 Tax=Alkalicoccobacillus plakortidis TaxID=444060 RepID=A0ABT0XLZ3_9BACI|nr:HAD family hydrolase [Alkalicoccobacillus plakortidis]MCM2676227.1 HAD family hydrolase [Alkalicoccobacillus plakortidis]
MNQAVFLDRDGVVNEVLTSRVKFVNKPRDFYLLKGVGESIKCLNESGFLVFIVTNQGGIGLGYMTESILETIHIAMREKLAKQGAMIDDIAYCSHKPNSDCPCRKPKAHMLHTLADKYSVDLHQSIMVGDREPDILAGKEAGCRTVLVHSRSKQTYGADVIFDDLKRALPWILQHKS